MDAMLMLNSKTTMMPIVVAMMLVKMVMACLVDEMDAQVNADAHRWCNTDVEFDEDNVRANNCETIVLCVRFKDHKDILDQLPTWMQPERGQHGAQSFVRYGIPGKPAELMQKPPGIQVDMSRNYLLFKGGPSKQTLYARAL